MTLTCYKCEFSWNVADLGANRQQWINAFCQQQNCSPLNCFSAVYRLRWYRRAFLRVKQGRGGQSKLLSSKMRQHLENGERYTLAIDTKIDDLGWPWTAISFFGEFRGISEIWDTTTAKWIKIDCRTAIPTRMYFSTVWSLGWFAVDFFGRGLLTCTMLSRAYFSVSYSFLVICTV